MVASRIMGAHAHACSDGNAHCVQEAHAGAIVHAHVDDACADETCIDTTVEAAEGVLAKLLEVDGGDLLAIVVLAVFGLLAAPRVAPIAVRTVPARSPGYRLLPPARAPPLTL